MRSLYEGPGGPAGSLYGVLGVAPGASQETVVHAYRQQARASHPDARPDDPSAAARFRILASAYEVLSDPIQKAHYDRTRASEAARATPHSGGFGRGQAGPARHRAPRIAGKAPDVFLDARPPRSSGAPLWAGPVRAEASPKQAVADVRLGSLASLLRGLMDGWSH